MKNKTLLLSKKLISIESVKEKPVKLKKALDVVKKELKGYKCKKYNKNDCPSLLFYNTNRFPKKFKIILNAHLDVVPGKESQFKPFVKKKKLYGRGAIDMKSAAAAMVLVYKELANKIDYPLGLQIVTDEEIGGFYGTKYQIEKGVRADFVIAGEPTSFDINNKEKGIVWLDISAKGRTAHGAYPWKGDNAILKINQLINKILKKYPVPKKESWITTANLAKIETSNKTYNKVPNNCTVSFDVRYIPEESDTIVDSIKKLVPEDYKLVFKFKEPAKYTKGNNPYIMLLRKTVKKVGKRKSVLISKHGGSDVRHFTSIGCPGISFGPTGNGHHTDNEWVSIKSLETYYKILKDFLQTSSK